VKRIEQLFEATCGKEFTAAVARIEQGGRVLFERAYGTTREDERGRSVYADTTFDLASLTKLFVATLLLQLVDDGRLTLDEPLSSGVIPEWRRVAYRPITARMLLAHTAGLNSGADYRTILDENVEDFALRSELIAKPGERVIYSDLGFIALGVALERITGLSLRALAARAFGSSLTFQPSALRRLNIPATEEDGWRGRVQGYVHDEKSYLMGYLGPLNGRASTRLCDAIVREAVAEQAYDAVLRRGLGWALKTSDENSCGRYMDRSSFGHTGFVGTCVWADPVRDLQGVLLTNSVYFGRADTRDIRARFCEAMVEECAPSG
jgi:serine-type D-Ala-D-Ala carboxypeptidase